MPSGPGQPAPPHPRFSRSLARHRWITAAGITATLAAVAGGGAVLAFHGSSSRPPKRCGLVLCAAALPASVRSGDTGPASASGPASATGPATAPAAARQPGPPGPALSPSPLSPPSPVSAGPVSARPVSRPEPVSSPAPVSSAAGRAISADHAIGVGYAITGDSLRGIHGQIVIVNNGRAPVNGWRVTLVLPGDRGYQVLDARNRSAGDALVVTAPPGGGSLPGGSTELIAFTAGGTTSSPIRSTFSQATRPRRAVPGDSAAGRGSSAGGGQARHHRHKGWPAGWLYGGWLNGGWRQGGRPSRGGPGSGWAAGGRAGQHHGWPGGR